jgi:hypothetical protein
MRKNDSKPAFAAGDAGYIQPGLSKKEFTTIKVVQGLLASGKWKGIEEGFPDRVREVTENVLKLIDEKA